MSPITSPATAAPFGRVLRSELRWVFRRPRTLVALALLAAVPVAMGIALVLADGPIDGESLIEETIGNGLALPIAALAATMILLLPLVVSMWAADALAGESAHGTLRALLLAPVGRVRLVAVKAFGVLAVITAAVGVTTVVGIVAGMAIVGNGERLLTVSGTSLSTGEALGRIGIMAVWVIIQMAAIGAIALAISSVTERPLVVQATTIGGLIVIAVLSGLSALDWLRPVLLSTGWDTAVTDVLRDPLPWDGLLETSYRAACYLVIGLSLTIARTVTRDA